MAYWICASANNQHDLGEELRTGDRAFRRAMLMCEGVLLVLDSVGTPFERCWCCFEVSMATWNAGIAITTAKMVRGVGGWSFGRTHVGTSPMCP